MLRLTSTNVHIIALMAADDPARSIYKSVIYDNLYRRLKVSGADLDLERLLVLAEERLTCSQDPEDLSNFVNLSLRKGRSDGLTRNLH